MRDVPRLILRSGSVTLRELAIENEEFTIGRALDSELELIDSLVSRRHSKIVRQEDSTYRIIDLNSSNGTYVNNERVNERVLHHGDTIRIGTTEMEFVYEADPAASHVQITAEEEEEEVEEDDSTAMIKKVSDLRPDFSATLVGGELSGIVESVKKSKEKEPGKKQDWDGEQRTKDSLNFFILYQLSKAVNSAKSLDELFQMAMELVVKVMQAERGVLMLLDKQGRLYPKVVQYRDNKEPESTDQIQISSTITNRVIREKVSVLTNDAPHDPRFKMGMSIVNLQIRSALCVPLWEEEDVSGLIYLDCTGAGFVFDEEDRDLLTAVGNQLAVAIKQEEFKEQLKREEVIRTNLARYHSPDVVKMIMEHKQEFGLDVKETEVTVLFSDIKGFSLLSERLSPAEVANLLNHYFEIMTSTIFEHRGTVNKFIGDAIMAVFGAPIALENEEELAVRAGLRMIEQLEEFEKGLPDNQRFKIRIGINTGPVVAGNIGSSQRMEYTVIGDAVNTASRLEKVAKPNSIVIGENTAAQVHDIFELQTLGTARLRGMEKDLQVFQVLSEKA